MIRTLSTKRLLPFLNRHMQAGPSYSDPQISDFLTLALKKANEFVPSSAGAIYFDIPSLKVPRFRDKNVLSVVACFGDVFSSLLGKKLNASKGAVGKVYVSGHGYFSRNISKDPFFLSAPDLETTLNVSSALLAPITIRSNPVGVIYLVNKKNEKPYGIKDFELLCIFADYISASIQNFLDAKRHAEVSRRDSLTNLFNDREFSRLLRREIRRAVKKQNDIAVIFLDLDHFKSINDNYGHLVGSRVLVEVANIIKTTVVSPRFEAARYGGDEFVVLIPKVSLAKAVEIGEEIRDTIEKHIFLNEKVDQLEAHKIKRKITASIGVSSLRQHVTNQKKVVRVLSSFEKADSVQASLLLSKADEAMYVSKKTGRNKVSIALSEDVGQSGKEVKNGKHKISSRKLREKQI